MKGNSYDHKKIESKWQKIWEEQKLYQTPEGVTQKNKFYILPQLPYPSGEGLHVGHAEVYTACDIYARFQRMNGKKVLQVIGWDAFGLPAENFAIKNNVHPRINTNKAIDNFRNQIKSLGISVDWSREVGSHNPDYYKWTQWFFLLFYERGLAYRKKQKVNWCPSCKTVLANEQVVDGKCERCATEIEQREMEQWYLKITEYADRLYDDLDKIDWPKETIRRQKEWIGKKKGAEITFNLSVPGQKEGKHGVNVFTTRLDTIFGVTFVTVSPEVAKKWLDVGWQATDEVKKYVEDSLSRTDKERMAGAGDKTGVFTEVYAINPVNQEKVPVWVADYVLGDVGTGAVMGVPAHDERDFEFAKKYNLPIKVVVMPFMASKNEKNYQDAMNRITTEKVFTEDGVLVNSGNYDGLPSEEARKKILDDAQKDNWATEKTTYHLHDWSVSRQRFWGAPIPMVYDDRGKLHPVKKEDLPVILPEDVDFKPTGQSPLTYSDLFQKGVEEKYGKGWKREVDTLDTFMCSSWYYYRYLDPHNDQAFASEEALKKWMPVDFYLGGVEHVNGHLLYARFFTKVLYDAGYINFDEPFSVHRHQGTILGPDNHRMSKRWGNVINPTDVVEKYGADTARVYEMFMGPLEQDKSWNDNAVQGVRRFLVRIWNLVQDEKKSLADTSSETLQRLLHKTVQIVSDDTKNLKYNTAIARFMEFTNLWMRQGEQLSKDDTKTFLKLLAPYAPHMTEELYQKIKGSLAKPDLAPREKDQVIKEYKSIHLESWPSYDEKLIQEDNVTIVVQVNGKVRQTLDVRHQTAENKVEVIALVQQDEKVKKYLEGKQIKQEIFVPGKLVNFVV
ncbi:leucine--tRNA ligase [Candidatus Roizmanbacteria bacterium RIFCSPLOWO2_01_FULL_40_14]|uniref:Leucine--tRNA ligase n=3 Tax=Candidatus Roizmaniibacteriota TaxID=1752723 RepID=A0A0G0WBQ6_9BACT|nr:MAG: Leucyl-tRNA ligase LeuS [Candidatus Roizmanbacteria bacterium GW2011_GWB1_40_7]KKR94733.1 MAG: Leucyl-tRNA ligase LeuS [Candidatus Roizmanbacteria bacterium GW2011_GWA1_41_13]OGK50046.1 MAG: leucine--tRNA ligase [Candidatus Roizmanbacteria bacterium RIFCSPLOWO2_01_FULL_40_14]